MQQQAIQQKNTQTAQQTQKLLISNEAILKAKFVDEQTIIGISKEGTAIYFIWLSRPHELNPQTPFTCCEDKQKKFDNRTKVHGIDMYDRSIKKFDFPMTVMTHSKSVVRGGFWDGKLVICPFDGHNKNEQNQTTLNIHQSTITAITTTLNEKIVISGSKMGDVVIWNVQHSNNSESQWTVRKHICDHDG